MPEIIDTHCHLYLGEFSEDRDLMMTRAFQAGVTEFYLPNIDLESIPEMMKLREQYPGRCFPMMGLHPCSVDADYRPRLTEMKGWLDRESFIAVGEIGLDFYWDRTYVKEQEEAFRIQMGWAREKGLPIVIHSRNSIQECINLVKEQQDGQLQGVFHCFSGSVESARQIIGLGFYLGIGGVVTYKNAGLPEVLKQVGLDYLVLETDAPYLTPVPFRGKRNEPAYLEYVVRRIAEALELSEEQVREATTRNARKLFRREEGSLG